MEQKHLYLVCEKKPPGLNTMLYSDSCSTPVTSIQASQDSISSQCYGTGAGTHAESKGNNGTATETARQTLYRNKIEVRMDNDTGRKSGKINRENMRDLHVGFCKKKSVAFP